MKKIALISTMAVWSLLCVYTLLSYWLSEPAWKDSELYTLYFLKMTALTFPLGPIVVSIGEYVMLYLIELGVSFLGGFSQQSTVFIIWLTMSIVGFFQWFVLVPYMYKRIGKYFSGNQKNT